MEMEQIRKGMQFIVASVDMDKLTREGGGITIFENIDAMTTYFGLTIQEIQDNTYDKNIDVSTLNKPFIVYDFNVSEFEFITDNSEAAINKMIERINNN